MHIYVQQTIVYYYYFVFKLLGDKVFNAFKTRTVPQQNIYFNSIGSIEFFIKSFFYIVY